MIYLHISYIICLLYVQIMKKSEVLAHILYKLYKIKKQIF